MYGGVVQWWYSSFTETGENRGKGETTTHMWLYLDIYKRTQEEVRRLKRFRGSVGSHIHIYI